MARFASAMAIFVVIGIVAVLVIGPVTWLFFIEQAANRFAPPLAGTAFPFDLRLAGAAIALAGGLPRAYGLLGLRRTFLEARAGRALSEAAVLGFRRFARVEFAMVPVGVLQATGYGLVVSMAQPGAERALSLTVGTPQLTALFLALLLLFTAEVFAEGKRAVDENALIP